MRTKALLGLAVLAAGAVTAMAQSSNVYSLNIVGYVNYTQAASKFAIIANPLKNGADDIATVFPNGAQYAGLTVFKRNSGGGYDQSSYDPDAGGWAPMTLDPGTGFWLATPAGTPYTNTFVGEVVQSSSTPIPAGYSIISSVVPQQAPIQTVMGLPFVQGDAIFAWNGVGYDQFVIDPDAGGWTPSEYQPKVGEGFWMYNSGAAKTWTRNFSP